MPEEKRLLNRYVKCPCSGFPGIIQPFYVILCIVLLVPIVFLPIIWFPLTCNENIKLFMHLTFELVMNKKVSVLTMYLLSCA